eukprot:scaffold7572_cov124-Isochrysis_galbana.AAC.2
MKPASPVIWCRSTDSSACGISTVTGFPSSSSFESYPNTASVASLTATIVRFLTTRTGSGSNSKTGHSSGSPAHAGAGVADAAGAAGTSSSE